MGLTDRQAWLSDKEGRTQCRHASTGTSQGNVLMYVRIVLSAVPNIMSHTHTHTHTHTAAAAAAAAAKTLIKTLFLKCCRRHRPSSVISLYGGRAGGEWTGIRDEEWQRNKDSAREENARIMPEVS